MKEDFSSLTYVSPALTSERLSNDLSAWFNDQITFTHWEYVNESDKGDFYLSEVYFIRIFGRNAGGESKHVQVVLKTIPKNVCRRLTFRSEEFFRNEIMFYMQVLPALLKFQSKKNLTKTFDNYAKLFSAFTDGVNDYICLEDASVENFKVINNRRDGVDIYHFLCTLDVFARFHAISFAMKDQEPDEFERIRNCLSETYYHESIWPWYKKWWSRICDIAIDAVEKEYPNSIYVDKIKQFAVPDTYKKMADAACNTLDTGVISHGDSWTNNFLFRYENAIPREAKMIDFQLSRCATPVLDISFFIYACTTQEFRQSNNFEALLRKYYEFLAYQIKGLGSDPDKIYPWEMFMEEMKKYSFFGLAFSFESTPMILLDPEDKYNMEMEGDQKRDIDDFWQVGPFKNKKDRLREANNIVHCVDNGYI